MLCAQPDRQSHSTSFEVGHIARTLARTRRTRPPSTRRVLAALVAAAAGWIGYAVYGEAGSSHALDVQVANLRQQNIALQHDIDSHQREVDAANSRAWLIEQARQLGYVLPGERVFILTTPGTALPPDGGIDVKQLPTYSPSPAAGTSPSAGAASQLTVTPTAAAPTPFPFRLDTPTPSPH